MIVIQVYFASHTWTIHGMIIKIIQKTLYQKGRRKHLSLEPASKLSREEKDDKKAFILPCAASVGHCVQESKSDC